MVPTDARDRLKDARRELYREAVLDAAEGIFADSGYEATRVADIASAAGISLATFYAVFKKKWDVYRAVHARRLQELMTTVDVSNMDTDVLGAMMSGIKTHLTFHMKYPNYLRMHLRERNAWTTDEGLRSPEQTEAWKAGLSLMVSGFETGMEQGIFEHDDAELMARTLLGMHQVRLALWVERGQEETPQELIQGALRQLIRSFCPTGRVDELITATGVDQGRQSA